MVKVYTASNGAQYIKLANGQCRFITGASKSYLNKIRSMKGGAGGCGMGTKGRCNKSSPESPDCELNTKTNRCKKVSGAAAPAPAPAKKTKAKKSAARPKPRKPTAPKPRRAAAPNPRRAAAGAGAGGCVRQTH